MLIRLRKFWWRMGRPGQIRTSPLPRFGSASRYSKRWVMAPLRFWLGPLRPPSAPFGPLRPPSAPFGPLRLPSAPSNTLWLLLYSVQPTFSQSFSSLRDLLSVRFQRTTLSPQHFNLVIKTLPLFKICFLRVLLPPHPRDTF